MTPNNVVGFDQNRLIGLQHRRRHMNSKEAENITPERIREMASELRTELEKSGLNSNIQEEIVRMLVISLICKDEPNFPLREQDHFAMVDKVCYMAGVSPEEARQMLKEYEVFNAAKDRIVIH